MQTPLKNPCPPGSAWKGCREVAKNSENQPQKNVTEDVTPDLMHRTYTTVVVTMYDVSRKRLEPFFYTLYVIDY